MKRFWDGPSVASTLLIAALLAGVIATRSASAEDAASGPHGVAVVIRTDATDSISPPTVDELRAEPGAVAQNLADAGLMVRVSADETCISACAPTSLSDEDFADEDLSSLILTMQVLEGTLEEDIRLSIGAWCSWKLHVVTTDGSGNRVCRMLPSAPGPPTEPAIAAQPLKGSVLWWAWPYRDADWGQEHLSIEPGEYTVEELLARLSAASGMDIIPRAPAGEITLVVCAENARVADLLWAAEVATGYTADIVPNSEPATVALGPGGTRAQPRYRDQNLLVPIPVLGYYSAAQSPGARELLLDCKGGPVDKDKHWIGWRFSDLPLLYRNLVQEHWTRSCPESDDTASTQLTPDETSVLWVKCVHVLAVTMGRDDRYIVPMM